MRIVLISKTFLQIISKGKWWGWSCFPFVVFRSQKDRETPYKMNHELIHHRQQLELLLIGFFLLYFGEYILYRIKGKNHYRAYLSISFEREAYDNQRDTTYLKNRPYWAFWKYYRRNAKPETSSQSTK
jgi:hypothetical protein